MVATINKWVVASDKDAYTKGGLLMQGWRGRLIFLLVIYFAGFATAIYCLAPVPENPAGQSCEKSFACSALKSDEFAQSFNAEMHKCLDFAKMAAWRASRFIKQKFDDRHQADG